MLAASIRAAQSVEMNKRQRLIATGRKRIIMMLNKKPRIGVGAEVYFKSKVYEAPYAPYYDEYKGHKFVVVATHHDDSHFELRCVDDQSIVVKGYVHDDELKLA